VIRRRSRDDDDDTADRTDWSHDHTSRGSDNGPDSRASEPPHPSCHWSSSSTTGESTSDSVCSGNDDSSSDSGSSDSGSSSSD
jgi:hypothetical protein